MKAKIASKLIKSHLNGRVTTASKKILAQVARKAIEAGLKPPFYIDRVLIKEASELGFDWEKDPSQIGRDKIGEIEYDNVGYFYDDKTGKKYKAIVNDVPEHGIVTWQILDEKGIRVRQWPASEEIIKVQGGSKGVFGIGNPRQETSKRAMEIADSKLFEIIGQAENTEEMAAPAAAWGYQNLGKKEPTNTEESDSEDYGDEGISPIKWKKNPFSI